MKLITYNMLQLIRRYGSLPRVSVNLDKNVIESLETEVYKPKKHVGVLRSNVNELPDKIVEGIYQCTKEVPVKSLITEGQKLKSYLYSRHPPAEDHDLQKKMVESCQFVERKFGVNSSEVTEEERQSFKESHKKQIEKVLKQRLYTWKAVDYDDFKSKVYLFARSAPDYAVLSRIFHEIKLRDFNFIPKSLFDFGSGVGTVTWAAYTFWGNSLKEYFCVDSSSSMNDLALLILKEGKYVSDQAFRGLFYRQFLPVSDSLKYDIVVSAFTLLELPSLKSRLETILTLWKKTDQYLIIVEKGTNAGFQVINEVRDFILEFSNDSEGSPGHSAHVFAPCPHDSFCPRFRDFQTPCNFEVSYYNPFQEKKSEPVKERFSYVVLKKGSYPSEKVKWPRIVRPVLVRSKHVVCRMCTPAGNLQEIVFSASKQGKLTYRCARGSKWGDLFPITMNSNEANKNENNSKSENDT